jgi:hypothetical protein
MKLNIPVTLSGVNGSATGNNTAGYDVEGMITHFVIPDLADTSDVTISEQQENGDYVAVLTFSNVTARRYDTQVTTYDEAGADSGQKAYPHITGRLKVTIEGSNAGTVNVGIGIITI